MLCITSSPVIRIFCIDYTETMIFENMMKSHRYHISFFPTQSDIVVITKSTVINLGQHCSLCSQAWFSFHL